MTSPRPSPHARGDTLLGATLGHPSRLIQSRTGGDTHRRTHKEMGIHHKRTHTNTQHRRSYKKTLKETHYIVIHTGGLTRKPQARSHRHTHIRGFTRTHIRCQTRGRPFTPLGALKSRFLREKEAASGRAGGHYDPPVPEFSQTPRALLRGERE